MFDPAEIQDSAFSYDLRLGRVKEYVDEHSNRAITRDEIAAVAGLEPSYFSRFFHERTGVRFTDWLTYIRITHAKTLLIAHDTPITQVALAVGYQDLRTFERAFHRFVGMTPTRFRKTARPDPI
jgi:two-component system response regulator YesN